MSGTKGVIQFALEHSARAITRAEAGGAFIQLVAWREILRRVDLIGQKEDRYDGYAYGNLSVRLDPAPGAAVAPRFLITGSQTSGLEAFVLADCAIVESWDLDMNQVVSFGETKPSSEALTHAAAYDLESRVRAVIHAHSLELWSRAGELDLEVTDPAAANGTPAMATAIQKCWPGPLPVSSTLAMGGHEDGILACGRSVEEAALGLLGWLGRALGLQCRVAEPD